MKRVAAVAVRAMRWLGTIEAALAGFFLAAIFVLVLLQIFLRFVPIGANSVWIGELARFSLVWLTFVVLGTLVTRNEHPVIESIDSFVKGMAHRAILVFANVVVVAIAVAFAIDSGALVFTDVPTRTPVMGIPMQAAMAIPFLGFVLAAVHASVRAFAIAVGVVKGDELTVGDVA